MRSAPFVVSMYQQDIGAGPEGGRFGGRKGPHSGPVRASKIAAHQPYLGWLHGFAS